jgi:hypothetical protein
MDKGPIADSSFKSHTFLRHVSMRTIDNCLKLKLSGVQNRLLYLMRINLLYCRVTTHWFCQAEVCETELERLQREESKIVSEWQAKLQSANKRLEHVTAARDWLEEAIVQTRERLQIAHTSSKPQFFSFSIIYATLKMDTRVSNLNRSCSPLVQA